MPFFTREERERRRDGWLERAARAFRVEAARAARSLEDGEMVAARIEAVWTANDGRAGFLVRYTLDDGERVALLPCDPLPAGGHLVRPGKVLLLTVVDDGGLIVAVAELVATSRARAA